MIINKKHFSAYLLLLITGEKARKDREKEVKRLAKDSDASIEIKKEFKAGYMTRLQGKLKISNVTIFQWIRYFSEKRQAVALERLWEHGYIEISTTEKGGKERDRIIQYLNSKEHPEEKNLRKKNAVKKDIIRDVARKLNKAKLFAEISRKIDSRCNQHEYTAIFKAMKITTERVEELSAEDFLHECFLFSKEQDFISPVIFMNAVACDADCYEW